MELPKDLTIYLLNLSNKNLTKIPDLRNYTKLKILILFGNQIQTIENLQPNLTLLRLSNNNIQKIENLPQSLEYLDLNNNKITKIENLPQSLKSLDLNNNKINKIESVPQSLHYVHIYDKFVRNYKLHLLLQLDLLYDIKTDQLLESPLV